jgi:predicted site-specific integrase-resolvase
MIKLRCAIYTRKSSEEGLDQDFNSLDAQHEACAAYIKSQASQGWKLVRERYDDGGISGGTLERPGLQRLLADIAAEHIDIVVVYKVDRLTRSLLDFAKLVEAFDKAGTSFVSITQSFNTTTSMGRLTLNMLLSCLRGAQGLRWSSQCWTGALATSFDLERPPSRACDRRPVRHCFRLPGSTASHGRFALDAPQR